MLTPHNHFFLISPFFITNSWSHHRHEHSPPPPFFYNETKILFCETNSFARQFAFVTLFFHPSFLCSCYPPCRFFRRSLYPNPNHAHPPQKLFSTSLILLLILDHPTPTNIPFPPPPFFCYETKILFCETNSFGPPFAFVTPLLFPIRLFCALAIPRVVFLPLTIPKLYSCLPFPTNTLFPLPHFFSTDKQFCHLKQNFCFFKTNSFARPFAFVTPFSHQSLCVLAIPRVASFAAHCTQTLFMVTPPPQPLLFHLSCFFYKFLLTPPPQTFPFHLPFFYYR